MALSTDIRAVLLDIEGTTTPLSFVHDTLFPYARTHLGSALGRRGKDPRIDEALRLLEEEHAHEGGEDLPEFGNGAPYARYLMDRDRKSTGLKLLQGVIWEAGYRTGSLQSAVYPDVPEALAAWRAGGISTRIYSSGSVLAQQLLFGHTQCGDLTPFIEGWYDTTTGPKRDSASYREIARNSRLEPAQMLFLSDTGAELDAARAAGLRTGMLIRPGNPLPDTSDHPQYRDFRTLHP